MNDEKQIAQTILDARKMREESYKTEGDQTEGVYTKDMELCLIEAGKKNGLSKNLWALLNLAMHWFNDIQFWSEDMLNGKDISTAVDERKTIKEPSEC